MAKNLPSFFNNNRGAIAKISKQIRHGHDTPMLTGYNNPKRVFIANCNVDDDASSRPERNNMPMKHILLDSLDKSYEIQNVINLVLNQLIGDEIEVKR
jgi:hypothetical protein